MVKDYKKYIPKNELYSSEVQIENPCNKYSLNRPSKSSFQNSVKKSKSKGRAK